ncbi:alpha/beta hydrolase-fold protein [Rugamonas apoptosis]|uniref:Esterase n=1 Tax=Rugamonas apoptosis TaxID=2758570 RepID=A0A7W2ILP0_9BURK|nr:alpha/beta hydrolase-fold protein [Rugamonas apoptosis]MBA5688666.1 esterase [Rugamonas apoptosis]
MLEKVFQPALRSPEIGGDGSLTFRVRAPSARQVRVELDALAHPVQLARGADGIWSGRSPILPPDLYCYRVVVDGVGQLDAGNPHIKPAHDGLGESLVLVSGDPRGGALPWQRGELPRGHVVQHSYRSAEIGDDRDFYVYTPAGYDRRSTRVYPVLYLLHGLGDDASGWFRAGRAAVMLDHLIHSKRCAPMLVVCPTGHCHPDVASDRPVPAAGVALRSLALMRAALLQEVLPMVEQAYAVDPGRGGRAVAGLSMGGAQALYIGLNSPQLFAHIGAFSPATFMLEQDYPACLRQAPRCNGAPATWIRCGRDDFLLDDLGGFIDWLRQQGVPHAYQVTDGGHTWPVWRRNFIEFVTTLFIEDNHANQFRTAAT